MSNSGGNGSVGLVRGSEDRFDFWVAALTALVTGITFVIAVLTPPKSGPFCAADCVSYPYTDFAPYIPRDFIWMYPALIVTPLFVILLTVIHDRVQPERRRFSRISIAFGVMAAVLLTADYVIQLRFVQPAALRGELDGLAPLTQYNPHGVFIALEEAGYLLMAAALLFAGLALPTARGLERAIRWICVAGFVTVATLFVVLSTVYGYAVEYRFEVAAITVDWATLTVAGALLAVRYR
jgi:hypothetical protein